MRKKRLIVISVLIAIVVAVALMSKHTAIAEIIVYKTANCGCCGKWVDHLQQKGFRVSAHNVDSLNAIKAKYGVPPQLASCHTALVEGYVVEGHVPADIIQRLLKERPLVKGIAVPGMPKGSPGMEGPNPQPYDILSFGGERGIEVFDRR